jgi:DUF218 domain
VARLVLALGCDLLDDGNTLGPRHISRLSHAHDVAKKQGATLCVAAGFSPAHPKQRDSMAVMSKEWLEARGAMVPIEVLENVPSFNTRGELQRFIEYAKEVRERDGVVQLTIVSASWHIPRVKAIFLAEFGDRLTNTVKFEGSEESFPVKYRIYEPIKRVHAMLPSGVRARIEKAVRKTGFNPSF